MPDAGCRGGDGDRGGRTARPAGGAGVFPRHSRPGLHGRTVTGSDVPAIRRARLHRMRDTAAQCQRYSGSSTLSEKMGQTQAVTRNRMALEAGSAPCGGQRNASP